MLRVIPYATDFSVDEDGNVYDKGGNLLEVSYTRRGKPRVKLFISKLYKSAYRQIARIVLDTFRPQLTSTDFLSVTYVDGDVTNVKLSNLQWSIKGYMPMDIPGVTVPDDAFVRIPGYSKYEISLSGLVRWADTKIIRKNFVGANGYVCVRVYPDESDMMCKVGIHRLLALTFLRHPWDCEHLYVNHKDSNPGNNHLSNLEWVTPGGNNQHAFEEGVRETAAVVIKNVKTGEEKHFISLTQLSEFLGKTKNNVHTYLQHKLARKFHPVNGWMMKYANDPDPWPTADTTPTSISKEYIAVFNLETHEVLISKSFKTLQKLTSIDDCTLRILAAEDVPRPWKGHMVTSRDSLSELKIVRWPNYKASAIVLFEKMNRKCKPVRVTDTFTNKITDWLGVKYWWRGTLPGSDPAVICRHLKHSSTWRRWKFTFFDLYEERKGPDLVAAKSVVV